MTISQALAHTIIAYTNSGRSEQDSIDMVFSFMDRRGLEGFKPAVVSYLNKMLIMNKEHSVVRLYSAFTLDEDARRSILAKFSPDCTVEEIIDPELIGGYRTEHAYQYVDATTAQAVSKLKQHLLHS